jgi:hypothetical protein
MSRHIYFSPQPVMPRTFVVRSIRKSMAWSTTIDGGEQHIWTHIHTNVKDPINTLMAPLRRLTGE